MKSISGNSRFAGPSLVWLALVHVGLFVAMGVAGNLMQHGTPVMNPYGSAEKAREFFANNAEQIRVTQFLFFASAIPLGIYAATIVSRLRYLGVRAAGTNIALLGGFVASLLIALSALFSWTLSIPEISASLPVTRLLHFLTFQLGGPGFAVFFGLLAAGVCVTSYFKKLLPGWVIWLGMVVAVAGELSSVSLVNYYFTLAIPVTRFVGFVWLIAAGAKLPSEPVVRG